MRHKSAYQDSAFQVSMVANDDGSKSGVFCVVKEFFVHLKLKLKVKINAHGKKKKKSDSTRTMRLIIISQPSVFIRGRLSGAMIASCC